MSTRSEPFTVTVTGARMPRASDVEPRLREALRLHPIEPVSIRVALPTAEEMRAAQRAMERHIAQRIASVFDIRDNWQRWMAVPVGGGMDALKAHILARIAEHHAAKCAREPRAWEMPRMGGG